MIGSPRNHHKRSSALLRVRDLRLTASCPLNFRLTVVSSNVEYTMGKFGIIWRGLVKDQVGRTTRLVATGTSALSFSLLQPGQNIDIRNFRVTWDNECTNDFKKLLIATPNTKLVY
ncbi:hypothetical protein P9112_013068 [Eukaryota sp. TZLM1-RC]